MHDLQSLAPAHITGIDFRVRHVQPNAFAAVACLYACLHCDSATYAMHRLEGKAQIVRL